MRSCLALRRYSMTFGGRLGSDRPYVFWGGFPSALKRRGLTGERLVISGQHAGLVAALKRSFQGAAHQRCRVHFARTCWRTATIEGDHLGPRLCLARRRWARSPT
jgi:transposase-like protein